MPQLLRDQNIKKEDMSLYSTVILMRVVHSFDIHAISNASVFRDVLFVVSNLYPALVSHTAMSLKY